MKPNMIKRVVILGGGAAGWITANHLGKALNTALNKSIEVILIESPDIPTIGVGEGTVPMMRDTLRHFGISETDFIKECDATFKQSIKFVDWVYNPSEKGSHYYHHLFDYPTINELDLVPYWLLKKNDKKETFANAISSQGEVCDHGLAPKLITHPEFQGFFSYAYHLDAYKFSRMLAKNAVEVLGVKHVSANVDDVELDDTGAIKSLITDRQGEIAGELFVDCSGFNSLLLGQSLNVKFKDKSDILFVDHAIAMQVPYENEDAPIASHTIATAKKAGWIWDIGLTTRRGVGYVYSSRYVEHDHAESVLRKYVGERAEGLNARKIPMKVGHREVFWHKNCVAIGLAQGFVEPLEATGLLLFDATARMLGELFPFHIASINDSAKLFNERTLHIWNRVIDFIKMHYCLSKRDDSQFWIDNRNADSIPDSLTERLRMWKNRTPNTYDFLTRFETFNLDNFLYVLYGMKFDTDLEIKKDIYHEHQKAEMLFKQIQSNNTRYVEALEENRVLIEKIKSYGMQKC